MARRRAESDVGQQGWIENRSVQFLENALFNQPHKYKKDLDNNLKNAYTDFFKN